MPNIEVSQQELSLIDNDTIENRGSSIFDRLQSNPDALEDLRGVFRQARKEVLLAAHNVSRDFPELAGQIHEVIRDLNKDMVHSPALFSRVASRTARDSTTGNLFGEMSGILRLEAMTRAFNQDKKLRLITVLLLYEKTKEFLGTLRSYIADDEEKINREIGIDTQKLDQAKTRLAKLTSVPKDERASEICTEITALEREIYRLAGDEQDQRKDRPSGIILRAKAKVVSRQKAADLIRRFDWHDYLEPGTYPDPTGDPVEVVLSRISAIKTMVNRKLAPYVELFQLTEQYDSLIEENVRRDIQILFAQPIEISAAGSAVRQAPARAVSEGPIKRYIRTHRLFLSLALVLGAAGAMQLFPRETARQDVADRRPFPTAPERIPLALEDLNKKVREALEKEPIQIDSWLAERSDKIITVTDSRQTRSGVEMDVNLSERGDPEIGIATKLRPNQSIAHVGEDVESVAVTSILPFLYLGSLKNNPVGQGRYLQGLTQHLNLGANMETYQAAVKQGSYVVAANQPGLPFDNVSGIKPQSVVMNEGPDVKLFFEAREKGELTPEDAADPQKVLDFILPRLLKKDPIRIHLKMVNGFVPAWFHDFKLVIPDSLDDMRSVQKLKISLRTLLEDEQQGKEPYEVVISELERDSYTGKLVSKAMPEVKSNAWRPGSVITFYIETTLGSRIYQNTGVEITREWLDHSAFHPGQSPESAH